nr:histone PARylation factor 1-like [Cherax quadricarinatus]
MEDADEWKLYQKDPRVACKYGEKCYRKNPDHLKAFKHSPKRKKEDEDGKNKDMWGPSKKQKTDDSKDDLPNTSHSSSSDEFVVPASEDCSSTVTATDTVISDQKTSQDDNKADSDLPIPQFEDSVKDFNVGDSPEDIRYNVEQKFLLEMPDDFFDFWDFCSQINKEKPEEALAKAGLTLVGPYDVLTGKLKSLKSRKISSYVCHWRYFYDPPEFMTVIAGDENEYHIGYYRDDPFSLPGFVASMSSIKPGNIKPLGENIFAGVWAESSSSNLRKMFQKVVNAKTDDERRKHFDDIQELITNVQFAYDEGDFGMGLELGLNLFTFGSELFHKPIYHVLGVGYDLLGREPYIDILQAHLKNRRRGSNVSILEVI